MPAGLGRRAIVDAARVAVCDDDEEGTDAGPSGHFLRCVPCRGQGTLVTRFGTAAAQRFMCVACRGRGFRIGPRPSID
jgi:hypothetical protein